MDKEYVSPHQMGNYPKFVIALILAFFPLVGIGVGTLGIVVSICSDGSSLASIICLLILSMSTAVFLCWYGWVAIAAGLARYTFLTDGLLVKYPTKEEILIPWDDFQQVCVCYAAYTTRGTPRANTVICCVKKGERKSFGRWKTDNLFRYRTVICIDYKESLLNGLKERYPGTVEDLRNTPQYRLR